MWFSEICSKMKLFIIRIFNDFRKILTYEGNSVLRRLCVGILIREKLISVMISFIKLAIITNLFKVVPLENKYQPCEG